MNNLSESLCFYDREPNFEAFRVDAKNKNRESCKLLLDFCENEDINLDDVSDSDFHSACIIIDDYGIRDIELNDFWVAINV